MKRRLYRPLAGDDPDLLLLDEPTTGLDPQARHLVWDRLYRLKQRGTSLVLTTHYMDEAEQLCDRLVVMDGGKIVAEGSPRELIEQHSSREVVEMRMPAGENEAAAAAVADLADRGRLSPTVSSSTPTTATPPWPPFSNEACDPARCCASQHLGGRLPQAHGPHPRRLSGAGPTVRLVSTPAAVRMTGYHLTAFRRLWRATFSTAFFTPLFYLTALGLGLGSLIDQNPSAGASLDGVSYARSSALASWPPPGWPSAGSTAPWPVLASMKWSRTFYAMTATPLRAADVVFGHALDDRAYFIAVGALAAVMMLFDDTRTLGTWAAVPAGVELAFAAPRSPGPARSTTPAAASPPTNGSS